MNTLQEIFDKAVSGLIAQGNVCTRDDEGAYGGSCAYHYGGKKCVVGQLITDEAYTPQIEGVSVQTMRNVLKRVDLYDIDDVEKSTLLFNVLLWSEIDVSDVKVVDLLVALQSAHDTYARYVYDAPDVAEAFANFVVSRLKKVAENFELEWKYD